MNATALPVLLCTDCLLVIANGTDGWGLDSDGNELGEVHAARMSAGDWTPGDGESFFSAAACDCCGTVLAGDRHEATRWKPAHADYPHTAGSLYDCAACEAACHCTDGEAACVWSGHDAA